MYTAISFRCLIFWFEDDNFWSEFLLRNNNKENSFMSQTNNFNIQLEFRLNETTRVDKIDQNYQRDKTEYQKQIFGQIFGKTFQTRTLRSIKTLPGNYSTYHFCQK